MAKHYAKIPSGVRYFTVKGLCGATTGVFQVNGDPVGITCKKCLKKLKKKEKKRRSC